MVQINYKLSEETKRAIAHENFQYGFWCGEVSQRAKTKEKVLECTRIIFGALMSLSMIGGLFYLMILR